MYRYLHRKHATSRDTPTNRLHLMEAISTKSNFEMHIVGVHESSGQPILAQLGTPNSWQETCTQKKTADIHQNVYYHKKIFVHEVVNDYCHQKVSIFLGSTKNFTIQLCGICSWRNHARATRVETKGGKWEAGTRLKSILQIRRNQNGFIWVAGGVHSQIFESALPADPRQNENARTYLSTYNFAFENGIRRLETCKT